MFCWDKCFWTQPPPDVQGLQKLLHLLKWGTLDEFAGIYDCFDCKNKMLSVNLVTTAHSWWSHNFPKDWIPLG